MKRIKVIQIGIGHDHSTAILETLLKMDDVFELAALAVPESEKNDFSDMIEKYKDKVRMASVDEAMNISDIDAVIVETEEVNLTKYAAFAAEKGFPVHMDKPGGLDAAAFERLIRLAEKNKTVLHIGYMYRYNETINEAVRKAKSGELGEGYCVEAHMDCRHTPEKRQWLARFPGGMMFFLGCHLIDLILRIMGEPEEIIPMNCSTNIDGVTGEDYGMVLFKYKNGVSFAKTCAAELGGFARRQLVICGSKGTIELRPLEEYDISGNLHTGVSFTDEKNGSDWNYSAEVTNSKPINRYEGMMNEFAKMVRGEAENPFDYEYELKLYNILLRSCGAENI